MRESCLEFDMQDFIKRKKKMEDERKKNTNTRYENGLDDEVVATEK